MHTTRTLIFAAVLYSMSDGITTPHPVIVVPDDTETTTATAPVALDAAALAPPTDVEALAAEIASDPLTGAQKERVERWLASD